MNNNKSEKFSIEVDHKVISGDMIKYQDKTMYITKIQSVEITVDGRLLVEGLWKEEQVSRMLRKFTRN